MKFKYVWSKINTYYKQVELFLRYRNLALNQKSYFQNQSSIWKTIFPKLVQIQKQDIKTHLKHSVYGYDPLHKHGEISMFLTLSSKQKFDNYKSSNTWYKNIK